jgi:hypothetical protein
LPAFQNLAVGYLAETKILESRPAFQFFRGAGPARDRGEEHRDSDEKKETWGHEEGQEWVKSAQR